MPTPRADEITRTAILPLLLDPALPAAVAASQFPPELVTAVVLHLNGSVQVVLARIVTGCETWLVRPRVRVKLRPLGVAAIAQLDFTTRLTGMVRGLPNTCAPTPSTPVIVIVLL